MLKAEVRIDPRRRLGVIDRNIYGGFIEHLGRCIYGGIYDPGSPLSDGQGFRRDVLEAMQRLRPPNLRWPGGCFADGYHWLDGVGPPEERRGARCVNRIVSGTVRSAWPAVLN